MNADKAMSVFQCRSRYASPLGQVRCELPLLHRTGLHLWRVGRLEQMQWPTRRGEKQLARASGESGSETK